MGTDRLYELIDDSIVAENLAVSARKHGQAVYDFLAAIGFQDRKGQVSRTEITPSGITVFWFARAEHGIAMRDGEAIMHRTDLPVRWAK